MIYNVNYQTSTIKSPDRSQKPQEGPGEKWKVTTSHHSPVPLKSQPSRMSCDHNKTVTSLRMSQGKTIRIFEVAGFCCGQLHYLCCLVSKPSFLLVESVADAGVLRKSPGAKLAQLFGATFFSWAVHAVIWRSCGILDEPPCGKTVDCPAWCPIWWGKLQTCYKHLQTIPQVTSLQAQYMGYRCVWCDINLINIHLPKGWQSPCHAISGFTCEQFHVSNVHLTAIPLCALEKGLAFMIFRSPKRESGERLEVKTDGIVDDSLVCHNGSFLRVRTLDAPQRNPFARKTPEAVKIKMFHPFGHWQQIKALMCWLTNCCKICKP